jgi:hypothetical protein
MQTPMQKPLEPEQYLFFLHFAVEGCDGELAGDSLMLVDKLVRNLSSMVLNLQLKQRKQQSLCPNEVWVG